jgi:hypothetical protein
MSEQRSNKLRLWFRWLFRRGVRGSLLLNMAPGDEIVSMTQYRQYLTISTRYGELYFIDGERLVEFQEAEIYRGSMKDLQW